MSNRPANESPVQLDLSDVDPRVGQLVGGGQLWEPCSATDIRRWVHAMDYKGGPPSEPEALRASIEVGRRQVLEGGVGVAAASACDARSGERGTRPNLAGAAKSRKTPANRSGRVGVGA